MTASVRTLLENSLYLSVADREFSPVEPSGSQINAALDILQKVLSVYKDSVPYYTERKLNGVAELQNIDAAYINALDYLLGNVVYNMIPVTQQEFSEKALLTELRAIPQYYWHDKANNQIRIYPQAQNDNDIFVMAYKPLLSITTINEPLPTAITPFYQIFLEYEVASLLCDQYNVPWTAKKESTYIELKTKLLSNAQLSISSPLKDSLKGSRPNVPWLAYLSGNLPNG